MAGIAIEDLSGRVYGDWKVLYRDIDFEKTKTYKKIFWKCECGNCGTIKPVAGCDLKSGKSKNCGCKRYQNPWNKAKLKGQRFGKLSVVEEDKEKYDKDKTFWKCLCDCGSIISVCTGDLKNGHTTSCGCIKSKGEEKIATLLSNLNIKFEREKIFPTLSRYRFDFYLPEYNLLIEYDGKQHFISTGGWNTKENTIIIQNRDNKKNEWCKENNILLLRISYTDYDKLNSNMLKEKIYEYTGIRS